MWVSLLTLLVIVAAFTLAALLGYLVAYIYYYRERRELIELKQEERKLREFNQKYER